MLVDPPYTVDYGVVCGVKGQTRAGFAASAVFVRLLFYLFWLRLVKLLA